MMEIFLTAIIIFCSFGIYFINRNTFVLPDVGTHIQRQYNAGDEIIVEFGEVIQNNHNRKICILCNETYRTITKKQYIEEGWFVF